MTIAATITSKQYTGNGVTTQFAFPNKIFAATDLVVTIIDNLGNQYPFTNFANATLGLTYTVQGVDVDTGAIVVLSGPLTNLWTMDIRSLIPDLQSTSIKNQGSFFPELHEEALDRVTRELQDALRLTYLFGIHGPDIEAVPWPTLPNAALRKGMALMFDAGTGLPALGVPNTQTITTGLLAPFLGLAVTAAETAALVVPTNLAYPPGDVRRYGGVGDGVADDTTALVNMFAVMKQGNVPGYLGSVNVTTRYRVRAGQWIWASASTTNNIAGPVLYTAGEVVIVAISGSGNAPLLYIHNEPTTGGRYVHGGYVGAMTFEDTTADGSPLRNGIQLYGVEFMHFGVMFSKSLQGDLIATESKGTVTTADAWHVYSNEFEGVITWGTAGWTFNNNCVNQVFVGNYIRSLWNLNGSKGAFKAPGADNTIDNISTSNTQGWAVDLTTDAGSTQTITINSADIDAPQHGIRISGLQNATLKGIRITYRRAAGVTSPDVGLQLDQVVAGQVVTGANIEVIHRIDPTVTSQGQMTTACTFNSQSTVNYNRIRQTFTVTGFTPSNATFATGIHASSVGNEIYLLNVCIHDSRVKNRVRAYGAGGNIVNAGYGTTAAIVPYSAVSLDDGGNYNTGTFKYTVPYTGFYRVHAQIRISAAANTQVRMAIMSNTNSFNAEKQDFAKTANSQSYEIQCQEAFTMGDLIWICADQNTAGSIAMDAATGQSLNNRFEVAPL